MVASRLTWNTDTTNLRQATDALHEADDSLAEDIPREMVLLAGRLAEIAKARVIEEPTHGVKQSGLRADLATGVRVEEIQGGASVTASLGADHGTHSSGLPKDTDDAIRGWRHPVFGHRDRWVYERFDFSWFTDSMQSGEQDGQDAIQRLLDDAARNIADRVSA